MDCTRILAVDDEEELLRLVKSTLERTGEFQVSITSNPTEVEQLCAIHKPDIILLDIVMPGRDGKEVIHELTNTRGLDHIKIIVTSGLGEMTYDEKHGRWHWMPNRDVVYERGEVVSERSAERAARAYGVDDYLAKPFSPQTLVQVCREVAQRQKVQDSEEGEGE